MITNNFAQHRVGKSIALLFMLLTLSSIAQEKWKDGKISISGKVLNFEKQEAHRTIVFILIDLVGTTEKKVCSIQNDGTFKFETTIAFTQDFLLNYGNFTRLICSPRDDLHLEIDADIWKNTNNNYPNGKYFVDVVGGTAAHENKRVIQFIQKMESEYDGEKEQKAIKEKIPNEYKDYINERKQRDYNLLVEFKQQYKVSDLFKKWAEDYIKYKTWEDLMRYRWEHPMLNNIKRGDFIISEDYYSFLIEYDMNDNAIISGPHAGFIHELYMHYKKRHATG